MMNKFIIIVLLLLTSCSFDYDNDYINEPPDSVIGKPCDNETDTAQYIYGDYYYCVECMQSADGLVWFEIQCEIE